jgi:hypothetical protein
MMLAAFRTTAKPKVWFAVARPALALVQIRACGNSAAVWITSQATLYVVGYVRARYPQAELISKLLGPWNAWFALSTQAARMCWEAQAVMFLRGLRMAQGGAKARAEAQRMVTEKVAALAEASRRSSATLKGSKKHRVAKKALGVYAGRVRRNRRRLAK